RIRDMIGDTMLFARPPQPHPVAVSLKEAVTEVASALAGDFAATSTRLDVNIPPELTLWADRTQLCIVLSSLLKNSLEASQSGTTIHVRAAASQPMSMFSITDQGHILSEAEREHLFEPFYSGRQAGRGLGFGLSKSWRIVMQHGGRIEVDSTAEKTEFRVFWPAEGI
ncbi:MAG: ATP-binding protein, partial [Planctomycetaceae bacterium]